MVSVVMTIIVWLQHHFVVPVLLVFMLMVIFTYWPSRKDSMERQARIPFDADL